MTIRVFLESYIEIALTSVVNIQNVSETELTLRSSNSNKQEIACHPTYLLPWQL